MLIIDCPGERRVRENRTHGVGGGGRKRADDARPMRIAGWYVGGAPLVYLTRRRWAPAMIDCHLRRRHGGGDMATRNGSAEWRGDLKGGAGSVSVGDGVFQGSYSFSSRFEEGDGTNPEELIAAAHASCFAM